MKNLPIPSNTLMLILMTGGKHFINQPFVKGNGLDIILKFYLHREINKMNGHIMFRNMISPKQNSMASANSIALSMKPADVSL